MVTSSPSPVTILDAARYVFGKAGEEGRPAVLNFSGSYSPFLFGQERPELERLLAAAPGRVMVASAGNGGSGVSHCRFELNGTNQYTVYSSEPEDGFADLSFGGFCEGTGDCRVGLGLDLESVVWRQVDSLAEHFSTAGDPRATLLDMSSWPVDSLATSAGECRLKMHWYARSIPRGTWLLAEVTVASEAPVTGHLAVRGEGVFHAYVIPQPESIATPPAGPAFRRLDNRFTLMAVPQSAVILAVGAYLNERIPSQYAELPIGSLLPFSSRGPAVGGLLKPDITAPGVLTSSRSGTTSEYRSSAGTSGAAAVVSGAAALLFESLPYLSNTEVMTALRAAASRDSFTGQVPNTDWGYGKLDILRAIEGAATLVADGDALPPARFSLSQGYPNPFNDAITMAYEMAQAGNAVLSIHDLLGQRARLLVPGNLPAGRHAVSWDGTDERGRPVGSGVYFCSLRKDDGKQVSRKMVLLR